MDILHSTWTLYTKGIVWLDIVVDLKQKIVAQALYPTGCIHKEWLIYFMTRSEEQSYLRNAEYRADIRYRSPSNKD